MQKKGKHWRQNGLVAEWVEIVPEARHREEFGSVRWRHGNSWEWFHNQSGMRGFCNDVGQGIFEVTRQHAMWEKEAAIAYAQIRETLGLDDPDE